MLEDGAASHLSMVTPRDWKDGSFRLLPDVDSLPVRSVRKHGKRLRNAIYGASITVLGAFLMVWMELAFHGLRRWREMLVLLVATYAPPVLLAAVFVLREMTLRTRWTFYRDHVEFEQRRLLRRKEWMEPLDAYRGVLAKRRWEYLESLRPQVLLLVHARSRRRSISLEQGRFAGDLGKTLAHYARLFGKPVLVQTVAGLEERTRDEVEWSLRKRVLAGKVPHSFDPESRPPGRRLTATTDGDTLVLRVRRGLGAVGIVVPALLLVIGVLLGKYAIAPHADAGLRVTALAFLAAGGFGAFVLNTFTEELRLSPFAITRCWRHRWLPVQTMKTMLVPDVTDVIIGRQITLLGMSWAVQVMADARYLSFGEALSRPAQQWVRDCIIAAISN